MQIVRRGNQGAGAEAVARARVEVGGAAPEVVEMCLRALARRDQHRRETRAIGLGEDDAPARAERARGALERLERVGVGELSEMVAGDADPEPGDPALQRSRAGLGRALGADRIERVGPLHRVERDRQVAHRARERPDVIQASREQHDAGA